MNHKRNWGGWWGVNFAATAAMGLVMAGGAGGIADRLAAYEFHQSGKEGYPSMTAGSKFFCNIKALAPAERAHHKHLTDKLISSRTEIVETEKGYEFQFNPSVVSIAELADWALAESKCCPFFDFHIDLEREGTLVCLRLTGDQGIKHFIQSEFQLSAK